jgi:hypothetical protein
MAVSNTMVQTNVDTNKHEDFNLVFTNRGKEEEISYEDEIYHLKRDSKSTKQRSVIKIYCKKHAKTLKKDLHFQLIEDIIGLYKDET